MKRKNQEKQKNNIQIPQEWLGWSKKEKRKQIEHRRSIRLHRRNSHLGSHGEYDNTSTVHSQIVMIFHKQSMIQENWTAATINKKEPSFTNL